MTSQPPKVDFPVAFLEETPSVQVPHHLSVLEAVSFKRTCQELSQGHSVSKQIILDFRQTTFMDSSGLGALASSLKTAQEQGIELLLRNVGPQVMAVLSLTELDKVFTIEPGTAVLPTDAPGPQQLPTTHPSVGCQPKRFLDIIGAIVGLIITAILFFPIATAIKLDSPGPIFFSQIRCGWMGKRFRLWKFRSMCVDAEARKAEVKNEVEGAFFKNKNDSRVTRVGRFLRRTSLDELPQFWNVLKGEMSLVGTRPPTTNEVDGYEVPEWQRLDVRPGMTGEWQVNGRSQVRSFEDVIRLDLKYQKDWSFMYDLKLILQTLSVLFKKNSGAV